MLVLTRKRGQVVMIGDDIVVKVVDVTGDYVKLGLEAPKDVSVRRLEVYETIVKENIQGAASGIKADKPVVDELGRLLNSKFPKPGKNSN